MLFTIEFLGFETNKVLDLTHMCFFLFLVDSYWSNLRLINFFNCLHDVGYSCFFFATHLQTHFDFLNQIGNSEWTTKDGCFLALRTKLSVCRFSVQGGVGYSCYFWKYKQANVCYINHLSSEKSNKIFLVYIYKTQHSLRYILMEKQIYSCTFHYIGHWKRIKWPSYFFSKKECHWCNFT